eukprot:898182-Amphidinium_carterae.1
MSFKRKASSWIKEEPYQTPPGYSYSYKSAKKDPRSAEVDPRPPRDRSPPPAIAGEWHEDFEDSDDEWPPPLFKSKQPGLIYWQYVEK